MEDVQSRPDERNVALDHAGVSDLRYPIVVLDRDHQVQHTVASISMSVGLPEEFKGTHMSRFIEVLNEHRGELTMIPLALLVMERRPLFFVSSAVHIKNLGAFVEHGRV